MQWLGFGLIPGAYPTPIAAWDAPANNQAAILISDIFGRDIPQDLLPISRAEALTIPHVNAASTTLSGAFGGLTLVAQKAGSPLKGQPGWLTNTGKPSQSPYLRQSRTLHDFMFIGFSLWQCTRGADGYPLGAWHVPWGRWSFDDNGVILIDSQPVDQNNVILFESTLPGLLNVGTRTMRQALDFEHTIAERARVSVPLTTLTNTGGVEPDDIERKQLLDQYKQARASRDGSTVAYVPSGFELNQEPETAGAWLLEARNAVAADIAKHVGIPASRLGSTTAIDSLTYTTELGQMTDLMVQTAHLYLDPIEARLSMGDVTPNGQTVEFDKTPLDKALEPTAPAAPQAPLKAPTQEGKVGVKQGN